MTFTGKKGGNKTGSEIKMRKEGRGIGDGKKSSENETRYWNGYKKVQSLRT